MTKIRIDVAGWEAFDGYLGTLEFKGGVSVRDVTDLEIKRIGANIRIVEVGSDEQIGPATVMVNSRHVSASVAPSFQTEHEEQEDAVADGDAYTEDKLNEIADKGGIKALRKIASEYGVKGVSIAELVKEILEAQKKAD